ncbi:MAG: hypothetical protein K2G40_00545, partial [Muribaculaceae bacterium]|nr:hypothetical protein [Muribaculaceae bacterium]
PYMEHESVVHQEESDTIHTENNTTFTEQIDRETTDDRNTVAVVEPPTLRIAYTLLIVIAIIVVYTIRLKH